jgi:hypothetical protein
MKNIILSLGLIFAVFTVHAQKVGSTVQIETKDNNRIKGKVIEKTETHLTIETASTGNITIERNKIRDIEEINLMDTGAFAYENQHASRNFMTPTAFGVKKGEGYYKNTMLIFNSVNYGITDHFSVGASADIVGLLSSQRVPFVMTLNTKLSTSIGKNAAIAGGFTWMRLGFGTESINSIQSGIVYSVITLGNKNHNFTVGGGYPVFFKVADTQVGGNITRPWLLTVSGQYRLSDNFSLLTENWFGVGSSDSGGIGSLGARYMRKGFAFDFAVMFAGGTGDIVSIPIPFVSVSIPFKTN